MRVLAAFLAQLALLVLALQAIAQTTPQRGTRTDAPAPAIVSQAPAEARASERVKEGTKASSVAGHPGEAAERLKGLMLLLFGAQRNTGAR